MHVIANDFLEESLKWLKEGTINFLIGQDAAVQGHSPVIILFQLLFDSKADVYKRQVSNSACKDLVCVSPRKPMSKIWTSL